MTAEIYPSANDGHTPPKIQEPQVLGMLIIAACWRENDKVEDKTVQQLPREDMVP